MDRVHGSWAAAALVHGGLRREAMAVAHRSSCSHPVRATAACHEVGKTKKGSPGFSSDLHRSLYGGKEAVRQWWSFGSRWRRCRRNEDQEEESWRGGDLHRRQGDLL
jgi:hypothetical protein